MLKDKIYNFMTAREYNKFFSDETGIMITSDIYQELEMENKKLKEALLFYAERNNWRYSGDNRFDNTISIRDASMVVTGKQRDMVGGKRARIALGIEG